MGADLICYIALGPTRIDLDESKKTTIAAQVRQYLDACIAAAEQILLGQDGVPDPRPGPVEADRSVSFCLDPLELEPGRFRCPQDLRSDPGYQDLVRGVLRGCNRDVESGNVFAATLDDLAKEVQAFVDGWNGGRFRDLVTREDPRGPARKIVVAGELSWGDEPDGLGYQMLKKAFGLTIAQLLGVR
jgi:hypothetical protein